MKKNAVMLSLLLHSCLSSSAMGSLAVVCTSELLNLVGEEVAECVSKQEKIMSDAREVFSGEMYRQVNNKLGLS